MFAPNKIWRKWHKKISVNQRRYAVSSALAASALPALVMARGHRVDSVPEFPLVLADSLNRVTKTKDAISILQKCGAYADVEKAKDSKKVHRGVGKMRNRRYTQRRGPMIVYDVSEGLDKAFRNLPGVELTLVDNLSLLDLAPGGHLGRFVIWTKGAFEKLDSIFGTYEESAKFKTGFNLPRSFMSNADLTRIINSDEVQSVLRPAITGPTLSIPTHRNPLKHSAVRIALNPYHAVVKEREETINGRSVAEKTKANKAAKKASAARSKKFAASRKTFIAAASAEGDIKF